MKPDRDRFAIWLVVYGFLSVWVTVTHVGILDIPNRAIQQEIHSQILSGTTEKPYNVRVLQPLIVQAVVDHVPPRRGPIVFTYSYGLIRLISLFVTFVAFELFLVEFVPVGSARATVLILVAAHFPTFLNYLYQPTSVLDLAFITVGLLCIARGWNAWLLPIILVATANRNTSIFIIGAYVMWHLPPPTWRFWRHWRHSRLLVYPLVLAACWAIELWLLARYYPGHGWVEEMHITIRYNFTSPSVYLLAGIMFLPLAVALYFSWNALPLRAKWLAALAIVYIGLHIVRGRGNEPRLWLPLYVLLGPALAIAWNLRASGEKKAEPDLA